MCDKPHDLRLPFCRAATFLLLLEVGWPSFVSSLESDDASCFILFCSGHC
ncbi:hypothetical protein KFK09_028725 [Dendrobium nobile]|uniref:Uncharacterized protein n=1 Tax=Dendrobium nobile TaxID=94219 RepID=A0A8T3A3G3_DENNO|nr:hypothetical protein KFK09_028725 [Dendrobium nobile]